MKNVILAILAIAVVVLAVLYVRAVERQPKAFPHPIGKNNNLGEVDCKTHGALGDGPDKNTASIKVSATDPPVSPAYEGVFVCTGETVYWEAQPHVTSIDVTFQQADWPFDPGNFKVLHADAGGKTDAQTVQNIDTTKYRIKPVKYTIVVKDDQGGTHSLDPHVIPMGP